jgi:hypothetical protein
MPQGPAFAISHKPCCGIDDEAKAAIRSQFYIITITGDCNR